MYNVHMNGVKIHETEDKTHVVTGVKQGREHEFPYRTKIHNA